MGRLHLTLLGGFQARLDGAPLSLATRKAQALLAYLAVPPGQTHLRDKLAALLWGEMPDEQARNSLRQALFTLRKALPAGSPVLQAEADAVSLHPDATEVDVAAFERAVADGTAEALERAAALYQGDLLAGLTVKDAPAFEEWLFGERERLRELALEVLAKVLAHQRRAGAWEEAVQTALRLLTLDPLQEPVHRILMRGYVELGRRGAALRQYQHCEATLKRELGVEPEAETKQLYQEILRQPPRHMPAVEGLGGTVADTRPPRPRRQVGGPPIRTGTPIVGRASELAALRQALADASAGRGRLVLVLGEVGVGKSRLLSELTAEALAADVRVVTGRCYDGEQDLPFAPWVAAMNDGRLLDERDVLGGLPATLVAELGRLFPQVGKVAVAPSSPVAMPPDDRRLFESVAELLRGVSAQGPVTLMLEDLHWADAMSLRLLAFIGRRLHRWPLLLVVTLRDEELALNDVLQHTLAGLQAEAAVVRLPVTPLSAYETAALVTALVRERGHDHLPSAVVDQIWQMGKGNPFVTVEAVGALDVEAILQGRHHAALPARVRDVLAHRLSHLTEGGRALLSAAAVIGRAFEFSLVARAAAVEETAAAAAIEELVKARIFEVVGEGFDFVHDRMRDVVRSEMLVPRRHLLHRRVGEAIEQLYASRLDEHALALGVHFREGGVWDKAAHYLNQAATTASTRGSLHGARDTYEEVVGLLARVLSTPDILRLQIDVRLNLSLVLVGLGELERVAPLLEEANQLATQLGDRSRGGYIAYRMANDAWLHGQYEASLGHAERALAIAGRDERADVRIFATHVLGMTRFVRGEYADAIEALRRNTDGPDAERARTRAGFTISPHVFACGLLAWSLALLGRVEDALAYGRRALEAADALGHPQTQGAARAYQATALAVCGDMIAALPLAEQASAICARESVLFWRAFADSTRGWILAHLGRAAEAVPLLARGAALHRDVGIRAMLAVYWVRWAEGLLLAGELTDAWRVGREALDFAQAAGERGCEAEALHLLARIAKATGGEDSAVWLERARAHAEVLAMPVLLARCCADAEAFSG